MTETAPIPLILSIHLNQVLGLYLLAIPPQLVSSLGWMAIPITGIVAFFFCGIDAISSQRGCYYSVEKTS